MKPQPIGIAYPWKESDREDLRQALGGQCEIPRLKPDRSLQECPRCGVSIAVGPRLRAGGWVVICALCAHTLGMRLPRRTLNGWE